MHSSRRWFLGLLASALVLDPERLLWVPGKKTISIPRPQDTGTIITIPGEWWYGSNHDYLLRANRLMSSIGKIQNGREILESEGMTIFNSYDHDGRLRFENLICLLPKGQSPYVGQFVDASKFEHLRIVSMPDRLIHA